MAKEKFAFEDFLKDVLPQDLDFVKEMHELLLGKGLELSLELKASGFVASYFYITAEKKKRTLLNYVFRKKGMLVRIYADNVAEYMAMLDELPEGMKKAIKKAPECRRMLNPDACNAKCQMGFDYILGGERQQKCRYNAFLLLCDEESKPYIKQIIEKELEIRFS